MNTCRIFLNPENREKVLNLFQCKDEKEKENLKLLLHQANIICGVTNTIGLVKLKKFSDFVKTSYIHWVQNFGHLRKIKASLHWTFAHISELLAMNKGYSLAEVSENSIEAMIKQYRYLTANMARQTSFVENAFDSLKSLYILSSSEIRKLTNEEKSKKSRNSETEIIESFFIFQEI